MRISEPSHDPASRNVEQDRAVHATLRVMLRNVVIYLVSLAVGGGVLGYLIAGMAGVWGAALGIGIAAFFSIVTILVTLWTSDKPMIATSGGIMGSWILKVIILFVVLAVVRERDFYHKGIFFVMIVAAIVGILLIEARGALTARIPATGPAEREIG